MTLSDATVLLVDDEPLLLELFGQWLIGVGCARVFTAIHGEAALKVFETESIDLLLTDLRMPVMDGVTLVRRLAALGATLPSIVFVSGFGDIDQREMYALGTEAFITKPCDRNELLAVLKRAIAHRSTLWHTEMSVGPRQSVQVEATGFAESASETTVGLGRGGFTICRDLPLGRGKIDFRLTLTSPAIEIVGQGYVRWFSREECKVGIEIAYLDPTSRVWVTDAIALAAPRSFIPGS